MTDRRHVVKDMCFIALSAAIIAVCSLISFPIGAIPVTLQTFATALVGYFLGSRNGMAATALYIVIGAIGLPVFAGFKGGFSVIAGPTGGFLIGFIIMAFLCGLGKKTGHIWSAILLGIVGLIACHVCGIAWFAILLRSSYSIWQAFTVASAPFLIKDAISVVAAYSLALLLNKALKRK